MYVSVGKCSFRRRYLVRQRGRGAVSPETIAPANHDRYRTLWDVTPAGMTVAAPCRAANESRRRCPDTGVLRNRRRRYLGCRLLILVVWRSHGIVAVERSSGIVGSAACRTHAPRGCVRAQHLCAVGSLCNGKPPSPTLYRSSSLPH